jgi:hypothetical protein
MLLRYRQLLRHNYAVRSYVHRKVRHFATRKQGRPKNEGMGARTLTVNFGRVLLSTPTIGGIKTVGGK